MEHISFSISELKIIIDALQASAVIPEETTISLTEKIADLGGPYCAELLQNNRIRFNIRKQTNNSIWNSISVIEESFKRQTQISFLYFKHDEKGNRVDVSVPEENKTDEPDDYREKGFELRPYETVKDF